jgi:CDGSH iron-sulfur domain-containing protein 3
LEKIMSEPKIVDKKPVVLELEPKTYYWCTCGESINQPYCNGAHKGTEFTPLAFEVTETKKVALCLCKHTGNAPFCDGAHTTHIPLVMEGDKQLRNRHREEIVALASRRKES